MNENGYYKIEYGAKRNVVSFAPNPGDGWTHFESLDSAASGLKFDAEEFRESLFPSDEEINEFLIY